MIEKKIISNFIFALVLVVLNVIVFLVFLLFAKPKEEIKPPENDLEKARTEKLKNYINQKIIKL